MSYCWKKVKNLKHYLSKKEYLKNRALSIFHPISRKNQNKMDVFKKS